MQPITARIAIAAPIEQVWAALTDHEGMARWPGIGSVRLRQEGRTERNGEGAVREIRSMGALFVEEVVGFEPPHRMRYRIIESRPRIIHEGGEVVLTTEAGRTQVVWTTRARAALPLLGGPLMWLMRPVLQRTFERGLRFVKRELEAAGPASSSAQADSTA
jgi:uncharacterized protein YndB with AHSA1/START domain